MPLAVGSQTVRAAAVGGNGCVHGVAAHLHGFQSGSRSLGAGGTDHAIAGIDGIAYRGIESFAAGFKLAAGIAKELEADGLYSYNAEVDEQIERDTGQKHG